MPVDLLTQERTEELAEREQELEAWQARMQSEASRQIGEREGTLQEWQTRLERKQRELGTMQSNLEVRMPHAYLSILHCGTLAIMTLVYGCWCPDDGWRLCMVHAYIPS